MGLFSKNQPDTPRRRQASRQPDSMAETESLEQRYAFRRNRTITGSASSHVAAPSETTAQLKSARVQVHELARQRRHISAVLFLVLLGALALFGIVSQFTANVTVKADTPAFTLDSRYGTIIQSYFSSQPLERLRLFINDDRLNAYVRAKLPEVASVKTEGSSGLGKTTFLISLRRPIAGWTINGHHQYVDASGTAFERNYYHVPSVQIVDKSGVQVQAGQAVASNRFLGFVGRAVGAAKKYGFSVSEVIIPAGTTRQVQLRLKGVDYEVKLSVDRKPAEQIEDMARAVRWLAAHDVHPQYVDVRVHGEAFYK
jgi:hypothetical protein